MNATLSTRPGSGRCVSGSPDPADPPASQSCGFGGGADHQEPPASHAPGRRGAGARPRPQSAWRSCYSGPRATSRTGPGMLRGGAEEIDRIVTFPVARRFGLAGWASVEPGGPRRGDRPARWHPGRVVVHLLPGRLGGVPGRRNLRRVRGRRTDRVGGSLCRPAAVARGQGPAPVQGPADDAGRALHRTGCPRGPRVAPGATAQDGTGPAGRGVVDLPRAVHTGDLRIVTVLRRARRARAAAPPVRRGRRSWRSPDSPRRSWSRVAAPPATAGRRPCAGSVRGHRAGQRHLAGLDAGRPLRLDRLRTLVASTCTRDVARRGRPGVDLAGRTTWELRRRRRPRRGRRRWRRGRSSCRAGGARDPTTTCGYGSQARRGWSTARAIERMASMVPGRGREGGSLGAPVPIDGFANGWRVAAECRQARFAFAPSGWPMPPRGLRRGLPGHACRAAGRRAATPALRGYGRADRCGARSRPRPGPATFAARRARGGAGRGGRGLVLLRRARRCRGLRGGRCPAGGRDLGGGVSSRSRRWHSPPFPSSTSSIRRRRWAA